MSAVPVGSEIKGVLVRALGVMVAVDKKREIYFVENVKIHLDEVEGLGKFLEVEAIGSANENAKLQEQCDEFQLQFNVRKEDFVAGSYSDLLMSK